MTIYDDEIDLRPYINAILQNWWKIGLLAIAFSVFVFIFTRLGAPSYQATATILVPRSQSQLSIAEQFPTIVDSGDSKSRMNAYLVIAQSAAIAKQTYQALADTFPEESVGKNLNINVEITNNGDAILITATAPSAQLAADIANEWANQTVQAINLAYSGEQPLEEIQLQITAAATKYQNSQTELETLIQSSSVVELQSALRLAETTLSSYITDQTWQLDHQYQRKHQLTQISDQANILKAQIEDGNASNAGDAGDALAVMNARANSFPPNTTSNFNLEITDITALVDTSSNYVGDINDIIARADDENERITQELELLLTVPFDEIDPTYASLASEIQALKAQLENLTARARELTSERDLAWDTYQTLLQKETEIITNAQTNAVLTFASPAISPQEAMPKQSLMKTAIAGIIGGMIGVLWVIVGLWWQSNQLSDNHETDIGQTQS
jgi:capsular polysaccharide biosynthesis protein